MKRLTLAICLVMAGGTGMGLTAQPVLAASLCVGIGPGCFSTIQAALNAANNGDVIHVGPGTFAGGISITKNVVVIGAGAGSTVINGGRPVVTIGAYLASPKPTVTIRGVTITGGSNGSVYGVNNAWGGGVLVVPAAGDTTGGTVSITDSVITGNTVAPSASAPCGDDPQSTCTQSGGAGIFNEGVLTLTNSTVSHNIASSNANLVTGLAQVRGGGIFNTGLGSLTLRQSTVTGNAISVSKTTDTPVEVGVKSNGGGIKSNGPLSMEDSTVTGNTVRWFSTAPVPQFVAGGGMDMGAPLTMDDSIVSDNTISATSTSTDPNSAVEPIGGGLNIGASATIRGSLVSGNRVNVTAYGGDGSGSGGGIEDRNALVLLDSTIRNNQMRSTIFSGQPGSFGGASGGGLSVDGSATIRRTTLSGNSSVVTGAAELAAAAGGALDNQGGNTVTLTDSTITGNTAAATTSSGTAVLEGAGMANNGTVTLRNTSVSNNIGAANGSRGVAQGGGIWNDSADLFGGPPGPAAQLFLTDSAVTQNRLTGSPGITPVGGGVYNGANDRATVAATNSVIAANLPDQCFDC